MIKKYLLITLAAFLLAACGGGSNDKPLFPDSGGGLGSDAGNGTGDSNAGDGADVDGSEEAVVVKLGAYSGADFKEGAIHASALYLSSTDEIDLLASIVEPEKGNAYTNKAFGVAFTSTCSSEASNKASDSFTPAEIKSVANGQISVKYKASSCAASGMKEDVITLTVYNLKGAHINYASEVASATVKIQIEKPSLEVDYVENVAELNVIPSTITRGGKVAVTAVVLGNNGEPSKLTYQTEIASSCEASSNAIFDPSPVNITNGYYAASFDSGSCVGKQTITLTLKDSNGNKIGTAQGDIEILDAKLSVLTATTTTLATGEQTQITADVVDSNNTPITNKGYAVRYSSKCSVESFSSTEAIVNGTAKAQYRARFCNGGNDVVTFKLYPLDASGMAMTSLELDSGTLELNLESPEIGHLVGGVFASGIKIKSALKARETARLSAIVVGATQRKITTSNFYVELTSACGAEFTDTSELTQNGSINAIYVPGECRIQDDITINLYELDSAQNPIFNNLVATSTVPVTIENPHLGYKDGADFKSGELTPFTTQLSAGGSLTVDAVIANGSDVQAQLIDGSKYAVTFNSRCAQNEPAEAEFGHEQKIIRDGQVSVKYTATGCVGKDIITFSLYSLDAEGNVDLEHLLGEATTEITVAPQDVGSINFDAENVEQFLAIKSIANSKLPNSSKMSFIVKDKDGVAIANKNVKFELSNNMGGVSLSRDEDTTDDDGVVSTRINSGTTHAVVSIKALIYLDGDEANTDPDNILSTFSLPFTVTTGLPVQYGFEISADVYNPAAFNVNNVPVNISVIAHDMWGNPVPDGTAVNFIAESGKIDSSCLTDNGNCKVIWESGGARPGVNSPDYEFINETGNLGLTTILAYSEGEAGFKDLNANGLFDVGEPTVFYPEAFLNSNWSLDAVSGDHAYVADDHEFVDYDKNAAYTDAPTTYQGALCSDNAKGVGHCGSLMHVRDQLRIVQTVDEEPLVSVFECTGTVCVQHSGNLNPAGGEFYVVLQDKNGNMAPAGTTLTVNGEGYKIRGDDGVVNNTIGKLDTGFSGLPDYGMLYHVMYKPEANPDAIELEADNNGQVTKVYLE